MAAVATTTLLNLLQKCLVSSCVPQCGQLFVFMPQSPNGQAFLEDLSQKQLLESLQNDSDFGPKLTWQGSLSEPARSSKSHRCLWKGLELPK